MKVLCISSSNIANKELIQGTSYKICQSVINSLVDRHIETEIIELRACALSPCNGCGECYFTHRCCCDHDFNTIYNKIVDSDAVFIVSPHYAPIPSNSNVYMILCEFNFGGISGGL